MSLYAEWLGISANPLPCTSPMARPYRGRGQLRADAMQALRANPGATMKALHAVVGGNETTLAALLMRLTDEGVIKRKGKRNRYTYREAT